MDRYGWIDGWIDGWMDGWTDRLLGKVLEESPWVKVWHRRPKVWESFLRRAFAFLHSINIILMYLWYLSSDAFNSVLGPPPGNHSCPLSHPLSH